MSPFFFWSVIYFILGLIMGSFLNVCIYRMPRGLSIIAPPSHCPECNSRILWYDNIPVVSYLFLKGRCRQCCKPIPPLYLIVEVLTAILFLSAYLFSYTVPAVMFKIVLFSVLVLASFIDIKHFVIPDESNLIGFIFAVSMSILFPYLQGRDIWYLALGDSLLGAFAGFATLGFVSFAGSRLLKKDAMGFGDVKFIAMIGAFTGWEMVLLTIMTASFIGAVLGGALMLFKTRNLKGRIPFGPYLAAGAVISVLFGKAIISWYFSFCGIS
ncbi:prepilin peptidase [bacterium]|jgi:leader peptidase (prepilin peptidase)/N-methyltransferase|nr:prepilin peptidase [bacterium]